MHDVGLHRTHLDILQVIYEEEVTISQLADRINKSVSWTSGCVNRLTLMDLATKRRQGLEVIVSPASNELSDSLHVLMTESPMINLTKVLGKAGLSILPTLLDPGSTVDEIEIRTSRSKPTIRNSIREWRGMGVVIKQQGTKRYLLHGSQKALRAFTVRYSQWSNKRMLSNVLPNAIIIWQWRAEYLFSLADRIDLHEYLSAGPTRLEELGFDILHSREYYFHSPDLKEVSEEEALVQALRTDLNNPRMIRFIINSIENRGVDTQIILLFGRKYGLKTTLDKVVNERGRKD